MKKLEFETEMIAHLPVVDDETTQVVFFREGSIVLKIFTACCNEEIIEPAEVFPETHCPKCNRKVWFTNVSRFYSRMYGIVYSSKQAKNNKET